MKYTLREVQTAKDLEAFVRFPDKLYKDSSFYIPSLHRQQLFTLSKNKNPSFEHCEARYWLAFSEKQEIVGRIAAIINHRYNEEHTVNQMRFGWLDFIKDEEVLRLLTAEVETWARERKMNSLHGPLGFTSFDASGVLIFGFDELPTAWGRYNYPYYDQMLTDLGFIKEIDWIEKSIKVPPHDDHRNMKMARIVQKRYSMRNAEIRDTKDVLKYGSHVFKIINRVYKNLYAFSTLTPAQVDDMIQGFLSMVHRDYLSVILNEKDDVVAFGLVMPSLSKAFRKAKGELSIFGKMSIFKALHYNDTVDMLLIGVVPEYQNKGAHTLIFDKIVPNLRKRGIKQVETTRELESNEKVQQLWEGYESRLHKRSRCYFKKLS